MERKYNLPAIIPPRPWNERYLPQIPGGPYVLREPVSSFIGLTTALSYLFAAFTTSGVITTSIATAAAYVGTFIVTSVISTALSMGVSMLTGASQKSADSPQTGLQINGQSVDDTIIIDYGTSRVGASRIFIHTTGAPNNRLAHVAVLWGWGKVKGIKEDGAGPMIWLDDRRMQYFETYNGMNLVYHEFHDGDWDQGVSTELQSHFAQWQDTLRWHAWSYFRLRHNQNAWTNFPNFTAVMEGRELFDPRDGSIAFSDNPALVILDFMTHPIYGGGIEGFLCNMQSFIDAATWFDAHDYHFNGSIGAGDRQAFSDNLTAICSNAKCDVVSSGGEYKLIIYKWDAAALPDLDEDDIIVDDSNRSNALGKSTGSVQNTPGRVKVIFMDAADNYRAKHAFWPDTAPSDDSDKIDFELALNGTTDFEQALKLAKWRYLRMVYSRTYDFTGAQRLIPLENGDFVNISRDATIQGSPIPAAWNGKPLRVNSASIAQDNRVALVMGEENEDIYDETVHASTHAIFSTTLPDPDQNPGDVQNMVWTTGEDQSTTQLVDAYADFGWSHLEFGLDYRLRYRKSTSPNWHFANPAPEEPEEWAASTDYDPGDKIVPTPLNGYYYVVTSAAGTSGATQPEFPTTPGATVADGGLIWTCHSGCEIRVGKLECNKIYYWQVQTIDGKNKSDWATPPTYVTTWKPTPTSISDVTFTATGRVTKILLKWSKPADPNKVKEWLLFRNTTGVDPTNWTEASPDYLTTRAKNSQSYPDDDGITPGTTYHYWLKMRDVAEQLSSDFKTASGASIGTMTADTTPPTDPSDLAYDTPVITNAALGKMKCRVYWTAATDDSGKVKYVLSYKKSTDATWASLTIYTNEHTFYNWDAGATYNWTVLAMDGSDNPGENEIAGPNIAVGDDTTAPAAPTIRTLIAKPSFLCPVWARNTESDLFGYILYIYTSNTPASSVVIDRAARGSISKILHLGQVSETGGITLTAGVTYHLWISAIDRANPPNESAKTYFGSASISKGLKTTGSIVTDEGGMNVLVDHFTDGTYAKIRGRDLSGGDLDFSSANILNKVLDYLSDGTYGKLRSRNLSGGDLDLGSNYILNKKRNVQPTWYNPFKMTNMSVWGRSISGANQVDAYQCPSGYVLQLQAYNLKGNALQETGIKVQTNTSGYYLYSVDWALATEKKLMPSDNIGLFITYPWAVRIYTNNYASAAASYSFILFDAESDVTPAPFCLDGDVPFTYTVPYGYILVITFFRAYTSPCNFYAGGVLISDLSKASFAGSSFCYPAGTTLSMAAGSGAFFGGHLISAS